MTISRNFSLSRLFFFSFSLLQTVSSSIFFFSFSFPLSLECCHSLYFFSLFLSSSSFFFLFISCTLHAVFFFFLFCFCFLFCLFQSCMLFSFFLSFSHSISSWLSLQFSDLVCWVILWVLQIGILWTISIFFYFTNLRVISVQIWRKKIWEEKRFSILVDLILWHGFDLISCVDLILWHGFDLISFFIFR